MRFYFIYTTILILRMFHKRTRTFFHHLPFSPEHPTRIRQHYRHAPFLRFLAASKGDVESRSRRTHRHTLRHQCSHVGRTRFSLYSDNDNSHSSSTSARTSSRIQHHPPLTPLATQQLSPLDLPSVTVLRLSLHQRPTHSESSPTHMPYLSTWAVQVP